MCDLKVVKLEIHWDCVKLNMAEFINLNIKNLLGKW